MANGSLHKVANSMEVGDSVEFGLGNGINLKVVRGPNAFDIQGTMNSGGELLPLTYTGLMNTLNCGNCSLCGGASFDRGVVGSSKTPTLNNLQMRDCGKISVVI